MQETSQPLATLRSGTNKVPWGWVVGIAFGLEVATVISAFVWVAIYSYLIHPGEDPGYYQDYAQLSSPIVSVVMGMPYWFFACRWVCRKAGKRAVAMSLFAWLVLFLIELPLLVLAGATLSNWIVFAISHLTKMLAAYFGGQAALKHVTDS